jgi:acylphosphatase
MKQVATLVFRGRFQTESFLEFVRHRAERLALRAGIGAVSADRIEVSVAGEPELLDAFELACSLGPIDCLVLECGRLREPWPQAHGGALRSGL